MSRNDVEVYVEEIMFANRMEQKQFPAFKLIIPLMII